MMKAVIEKRDVLFRFFFISALALLVCLVMTGCMPLGNAQNILDGSFSSAPREVYDAKSGTYVTQVQYFWYNVCDILKSYVLVGVIASFIVGFIIRRIDHENASFRRFGFFLDVWVPVLYLILVYGLSYFVDSFYMNM